MEQNIKGAEGIDVEQIGSQATITINRPDVMNAMTTQMFADFGRICREISRSETVRVVVIQFPIPRITSARLELEGIVISRHIVHGNC